MHARALAATLVLGGLLLAVPPCARADPPACPADVPDDAAVQARLDWIERRIDDQEDDVRRWYTGAAVFHALLIGTNVVFLASTPDDQARIDFTVNAIGGTLGLLTLLISTPPILGAGDFLRALPRETPADRLASLRAAEQRLQRSADAASFVRSPFTALLSVGYVEAASLTLLFLDRPVAATLHAAGGSLIGLGRLLLHPSGIIDAWRRYQARHPEAGCAPDPDTAALAARYADGVRFAVYPAALPIAGAGIGLAMTF